MGSETEVSPQPPLARATSDDHPGEGEGIHRCPHRCGVWTELPEEPRRRRKQGRNETPEAGAALNIALCAATIVTPRLQT